MLRNRHDTWAEFCGEHRELLAATGLPAGVTHSEHRFRELLERGVAAVGPARATLDALAPAQWAAFHRFATLFFREFESYAPEDLFPAFRSETLRRGTTFPR